METKQLIEKIVGLTEDNIGPTEENVKQKFIVPLLELLGHKKEELEFEYPTQHRRGKIDILIKNVPTGCKVIIDTKNYTENLDNHIEQIREYTFDESALLAVIANGIEIRVYSPLRGVDFERSLLLVVKREDLARESVWIKLSEFLNKENLQNRSVINTIEKREREIKEALATEERLKEEYDNKIEAVDSDIETRKEEIDRLNEEKDKLQEEQYAKTAEIWDAIGLSLNLFKTPTVSSYATISSDEQTSEYTLKAGRVTFKELADRGLIRDGQTLLFYHTQLFKDEQARVIASANKLKYRSDGKIYSVSELAKVLLKKHGFKRDEHGVAGPRYWKTEDGHLLDDINEGVRKKRGDRK